MSDLSTTLVIGQEVQTDQLWQDAAGANWHIYRKVLDLTALPNAGAKNVAHGVATIKLDAYNSVRTAWAAGGGNFASLEAGSFTAALNATNLVITTTTNLSAQSGFAVIEYCKTGG